MNLLRLRHRRRAGAAGEILLVGLAYWLAIRVAASWTGGLAIYKGVFFGTEEELAASFTRGALVQLAFVAAFLLVTRNRAVRKAAHSLSEPAARPGWIIALIVAVVDIGVLYAGWIPERSRALELSLFSVSMSLVPALDGLAQEMIFRGYVVLRMAEAGFSRWSQIVISGGLFGALHFGYGQLGKGAPFFDFLVPALGTFGLGAAWAFCFQESGNKLLPVVFSHVVVIVAVQPWLALSYLV